MNPCSFSSTTKLQMIIGKEIKRNRISVYIMSYCLIIDIARQMVTTVAKVTARISKILGRL